MPPIGKSLKALLWVAGVLLALLLLAAALGSILWSRETRPKLQAAASQAFGMEVSVRGRISAHFAPSFSLTLHDVQIRNRDTQFLSAEEVRLSIDLLPLLHDQVQLHAMSMRGVALTLEQARDGKFNFERETPRKDAQPGLPSIDVALRDATVTYTNRQTGMAWRASGCELKSGRLAVAGANDSASAQPAGARTGAGNLLTRLTLTASMSCDQLQTEKLAFSALKTQLDAKAGIFEFHPLSLRSYQGEGAAQLRVDFNGPLPAYRIHYTLSKFRIEEFWRGFSQKKFTAGAMDFATDLTASGRTMHEMTQSSEGEASLRGENLTLQVGNLDQELSRYESTQKFDLIDAGAFLFAGPLGVLVTKGYDYAKVLDSGGGSSQIRAFVSLWQVDHGVARAKDVAMSTDANRIALTGALDFVNEQFLDVTVALVDKQGCVRVQQHIRGSFAKPEMDKPNVVTSLTGPARNLVKQAKKMLGGSCPVFYAGSLPAPP